MKKIELSKEEYKIVKKLSPKNALKHFSKYYFIYNNINQLKLMRYLLRRNEEDLCH